MIAPENIPLWKKFLADLRKSLGMTQEELAATLGDKPKTPVTINRATVLEKAK